MDLEKILSLIKLLQKYLLAIAVLSTALLFLPLQVLKQFGVEPLVQNNRMWIGLFCLASYSILLALLIKWFIEKISKKLTERKRKNILRDITPEEKRIHAKYILLKTKSQTLPSENGVTNGLVHSNIINQASPFSVTYTDFAYNIQPWAWKELNAHPELLEPELSNLRKMEGTSYLDQKINWAKLS